MNDPDDRWVKVRASVLDEREERYRELEKERDRLRAKCESTRKWADEVEGFNRIKNDELASQKDKITRLRECLRRLEWSDTGVYCPACGRKSNTLGHASECWLKAALEE